jgi:hypothetical protein
LYSAPSYKRVFLRFLVIGLGIPLVLLAASTIIYFSHPVERKQLSPTFFSLITLGLAAAGAIIWIFFSKILYHRLWTVFGHLPELQDAWTFAEGVYGLIGVGISLSSALGLLYYLISGDFLRSLFLHALAVLLLAIEVSRFLPRMDRLEEISRAKDGNRQEL